MNRQKKRNKSRRSRAIARRRYLFSPYSFGKVIRSRITARFYKDSIPAVVAPHRKRKVAFYWRMR